MTVSRKVLPIRVWRGLIVCLGIVHCAQQSQGRGAGNVTPARAHHAAKTGGGPRVELEPAAAKARPDRAQPAPSSPTASGASAFGPAPPVIRVAVGFGTTCALTASHEVWCWGLDLTSVNKVSAGVGDLPRLVRGASGATDVAISQLDTACAILGDGKLTCWGANMHLEAGTGPLRKRSKRRDFITPVIVPIQDVVRVSPGSEHTCAVISDGTVKCWGNNDRGQLGLSWPDGSGAPDEVGKPTTVPGVSDVADVVSGYRSTCVLHHDHTLSCWGEGFDCAKPSKISEAGSDNIALSGSDDAYAVLKADGSVWTREPLGMGTGHDEACTVWKLRDFKQKQGLSHVVQLSASVTPYAYCDSCTGAGCAVLADGSVQCWQDGSANPVSGLQNAKQVSGGIGAACAVAIDDHVRCWGRNLYGRLGDGSPQERDVVYGIVEPHWPIAATQTP